MYQQIMLIGNVGDKDAELRYTPSGKAVASFSMATNKTWTDGNGERQSKSIWWRVTAWDQQANVIGEYVKAKMKIMVIGEIEEARPFTDREGNQRASLEVRAHTIKFLSGKSGSADDTENIGADLVQRPQTGRKQADPEIPF